MKTLLSLTAVGLLSTAFVSLPAFAGEKNKERQSDYVTCPFKGELAVKYYRKECELYIPDQRASFEELRARGFSEKSIRFQRKLALQGKVK